jgi:large subunit ribosomal protein L10
MPLNKKEKETIVDFLKDRLSKQKSIVLFDYTGVKVKDLTSLRNKLKETGNEMKIAKKTLFSIAFKACKLDFDFKKIKTEIALAFGLKDEVSPAKLIDKFAKDNKTAKILGGFLENKFIDEQGIKELALLPSKNELLAKLVGQIAAPCSGFLNVLQGNISGLVRALSQIKK